MLVSVIIPTYNREKYIQKALDSVFFQSFQDFEVIVIDDGSTDTTKKLLEPLIQQEKVKYIYQQNLKVSKARNNGIRNASGKYIALLDSDDYWLDPQKLEKQVNYFENQKDCVLNSGGIIRITENGEVISKILNPELDKELRENMLLSCLFTPSGAMFKKELWEKIGGFNENSDLSEDWEFFMELGKYGTFYNFQDYFVAYLQGNQNRSNFNRRANLKYNLGLIKKYKELYPNFKKAYRVHFFYYFYSFLPFKNSLIPLASKVKQFLFGKPAYKKFNK